MTDKRQPELRPIKSRKNPIEWHGHRIVTENDLESAFGDDGNVDRPHVYMRRLRHGIVLVILVVLVTAAVLVALGISRGDIRIAALEPDPIPTTTCPAGPFDYQDPATVEVNVFNSTNITGLAGTASEILTERAFVVSEVGNRPVNRTGMTAIVVSGPNGYPQAFTVQRSIPDTVYVEDERTDASVDIVVGSGFESLLSAESVDATPGGLVCTLASEAASAEPTP